MKTLSELSAITNHNVIAANFHDKTCYHLLIQVGANYYISYYVDGQKMGLTLKGTPSSNYQKPYKRIPAFNANI